MAISRRTQKDVGNFEPKFIGPFTTRQTVFVGIAAAVCYITHAVARAIGFDLMTQMVMMIILAGPVILIGFSRPYGMKCEDFLIMYWFYHIKAPAVRKYVTVTDVDIIIENERKKKNSEMEKDGSKDDKGKNKKKTASEPPRHKKDKQIKEYA